MTGSQLPAHDIRPTSGPLRSIPRRSGSGRVIAYLPQYDVRVRRELAHRRFYVSLLRQVLRLATLHALDAAAVLGAGLAAGALLGVPVSNALPSLIAFVLVGLNVRGSYRPGDSRRDPMRLVTGAAIGLLLALLLPAATRLPLAFVGVFGLATVVALIVERRIVDAIVHQAYARGIGMRRALVVTQAHEYTDLLARMVPGDASGRPAEDQVIVGYVSPDRHDTKALGGLAELPQLLDSEDVSELLVATSLSNQALGDVSEACFERGVRLLVIPSFVQSMQGGGWAELTRIGRWPAYHLHPARLELPSLLLKRATDLALSSAGLVLTLPLMALIAAAIKLESHGPVFFRQRRVGLGGREFQMWKFRSMAHEAEARQDDVAHLNTYADGRLFKTREDPRITRVGRLLRRFSLDELPQLFNILMGDMSLVGPRPPLPAEVRQYEQRHFVRLSVVPGLTGPWQVNGRNLVTDFEHIVALEKAYIENWSLRSDLEIILRTFVVVIEGKGAY